MDELKLQEMDKDQRRQLLEDNADQIKEEEYSRKLSDEELREEKDSFSKLGIELQKMEEEKKAFLDELKQRRDPVKVQADQTLYRIKTGFEVTEGRVYYMADHDEAMMYSYNEYGELLNKRPLTAEERQTKIKPMSNSKAQ